MDVRAALEPPYTPGSGHQHACSVKGVRLSTHPGTDGGYCEGNNTHVRRVATAGDGAIVDDGALGGNDEGGRCLRHGQQAENVDFEHAPRLVDVGVQDRHGGRRRSC